MKLVTYLTAYNILHLKMDNVNKIMYYLCAMYLRTKQNTLSDLLLLPT